MQGVGAQAGKRVSLRESGCYGLKSVSLNSRIPFLNTVPQNQTVFGDRVFTEIIK